MQASAPAKVSRPGARLIGRDGLVSYIRASDAPLVWVAAPAGSGKTSLGLEYTQRAGGPVAWLRLDEADNDPASFTHYFEQAIANGAATVGAWKKPQLLGEHLPAPQGYIRLFVRSLAAHIADDACLVLDDAHKCQEVPFFRQFLNILVEELPRGVRTLILSRSAPPEGCARLLAHGQMLELDPKALAFTPGETERLLEALGLAQAAQVRDTVFNYTHGWAAGIALVASWLKRRPEAATRLDDISQLVTGYLTTEVFSTFTATENETLLSVCWLPYFRTGWAPKLSGVADADAVLARLAQQGGLIYEYPGPQYTLHPLFQWFLRERANSRIDEARRRGWIEQGLDLLMEDANPDVAIELALEYELMARAPALIEQRAASLFAGARHQTLARWIDRLPEERRSPWLHYWRGMAIFMSGAAEAREALLKAYEAFTAAGNRQHRIMVLSSLMGTFFFDGRSRMSLRQILERYVDPGDYDGLTDANLKAHLGIGIVAGLLLTDPGHPDLDLWERRALEVLHEQRADPLMVVRLATMLANHYFLSGRYRRLRAVRAFIDRLPEEANLPSFARYVAHYLRLYDALSRADHAAVAASFADTVRCAEDTGIHFMYGYFALHCAASKLMQNDLAAARAIIADVAAKTPPGYYNMLGHLHIIQGWTANWSGDHVAALDFARRVREDGRGFGSVPYETWGRIGECVAATLLGLPDANERVAALREIGAATRYPAAAIHADLLDAWRLRQEGDTAAALAPLRAALARLSEESEGFLWLALPQILQPLCALALQEEVETETARAVIRVFRLAPPSEAPRNWPWPLSVQCFGGFELRVQGEPLPSRGKSKHRQLEVLKLVAAHAPTPVATTKVAELLWPDSDGDAARHALETTLSRLRTTLGCEAFRVEHGAIALDGSVCRVDAVLLEGRIGKLESAVAAETIVAGAAAVLDLYRGELLAGESAAWLLLRREYWHGRIARALGTAARQLAAMDRCEDAAHLLEHALAADPFSEPLTTALMEICLNAGRYAEGMAAYRRYRRMALSALGVPMAAEVESLARRLQEGER